MAVRSKYKAVFFDVDGTLVDFETHAVPPSAAAAVREMQSRGVKAVVATGRLRRDIRGLEAIRFDGYVTVNGGCCQTACGEVLFEQGIDPSDLALALRAQRREHFPLTFMVREGIFAGEDHPRIRALADLVGLERPKVADLERLAAERTVYQANIYVDEADQERVMRWFPHCTASRWNAEFADVNSRGVDKAGGLLRLSEAWGIDPSETVAFGDGGNDVPMLRAAGVGVAMGGSCPEALAVADRVTDTVARDGVAKALRELGLIG